MSADCACGSRRPYAACCGALHGGAPAACAEALMRSRYCAYVLRLDDYLLATWHPATRPASLDLTDQAECKWLGLEVRRQQLLDPEHAMVEYVARWRVGGRGQRLHESSRFARDAAGHWLYVDGDIHSK